MSQVWAHPLFSCLNRGARCQPKLDLDAEGGEAGVGGWELGVIRVQAAAAAARERECRVCAGLSLARSLSAPTSLCTARNIHARPRGNLQGFYYLLEFCD